MRGEVCFYSLRDQFPPTPGIWKLWPPPSKGKDDPPNKDHEAGKAARFGPTWGLADPR
jgi:hypothetical protein